jgi:hypothetical protein
MSPQDSLTKSEATARNYRTEIGAIDWAHPSVAFNCCSSRSGRDRTQCQRSKSRAHIVRACFFFFFFFFSSSFLFSSCVIQVFARIESSCEN